MLFLHFALASHAVSLDYFKQDTLNIPGVKKVRGGGRGDGSGGGRGDGLNRTKRLPENLIDSATVEEGTKKKPEIEEPQKIEPDTARVQRLLEIGISYRDINIDSAVFFTMQALSLSQEIEFENGRVSARNFLNHFYQEGAKPNEGIENGILLLDLLANRPDFDRSVLYRSMAMFYQLLENVQEASNYWNLAVKSLELKKDTVNLMTVYIDAAIFHDSLKEFDEALELLEAGLALAELTGNYIAEHYFLGSIGNVYSHRGEFDQAVDYLNQSLRLKKLHYRPVSLAYGYYHLQKAYLKEGLFEESIQYGEELQRTLNINPGTYLFKRSIEATRQASDFLGSEIPDFVEESNRPMLDALSSHERLMQERQFRALANDEKTSEYIYFQQGEIGELEATTDFQEKVIVFSVVGLILLFGSVYLIRSRSFALQEKRTQEVFSRQLLDYQEEERQRISRDLHDSIGQSLVLIKNKVQLKKDEETSSLIAKTLEEVQSISKQLHPLLLEKLGLTKSVRKLVEDLDNSTDVFIESEVAEIDGVFPKAKELHIYRIMQEAINNMVKHAETVSAKISIEKDEKIVTCSVIDRGNGFDLVEEPEKFQSLGMQTLKERTKVLQGKLLIDSTKGKGTAIVLKIDIPKS